jgi:hypothetical protein
MHLFCDIELRELAMTKFLNLGWAALLSVMLLTNAFAGGHTGGGMVAPDGEMQLFNKMGEQLNLSEAQKTDFMALLQMYQPRFKALAERGKADRQALLTIAPDDPSYGDLAGRVSQEAGLAAAETVTLVTELQGLIYSLLSSEQQANYLALRVERQVRMAEMRSKMQEGGKDGFKAHHGAHHGEEACPHHEDATAN